MSNGRRIVLYSHDTMGLGHMRRNLLLAQALASSRRPPAILMVFGAGEAQAWSLPPGTECLTLPAVHKGPDGRYRSRAMAVPLESVIAIRRRVLVASLEAFRPDLIIVDKVPGGLAGELEPALRMLRRRGETRCVLGLRDVLDDPAQVRAEWLREDNYRLASEYYDAIWIYGDPRVADPVERYGFGPDLLAKVHYTGYLDPSRRDAARTTGQPSPVERPIALCVVGGGQDGGALADAFSRAAMPAGVTGVIVTGPHLPPSDYRQLVERTAGRPDLEVRRFDTNLDALLSSARSVVAMGGYNTVMEVLAYRRRALIVPRVTPRTEQLIRARRLAELGLVDVERPEAATPERLSAWLAAEWGRTVPARSQLDFGGLARVNLLTQALLAAPRGRTRRPRVPLVAQLAAAG